MSAKIKIEPKKVTLSEFVYLILNLKMELTGAEGYQFANQNVRFLNGPITDLFLVLIVIKSAQGVIIAVKTSSSSEEKVRPLVCLSMKLFQYGTMKQKLHVIRYASLL